MNFLVHSVKLKPIIKDQIPGKLVTSGISNVATASVHSEKTWAKKWIMIIITRIMVTIKKRAGVIPYSFSSSIALLSSLLSCSFYLLDPRTISRVDILEMT